MSPGSGKSTCSTPGRSAAASSTRARTSGSASSVQATAARTSALPSSAEPEGAHQLRAAGDRAGHRPRRVEAGGEREDAVRRQQPPGRLEADDSAARRREADGAGAVGPEREVTETDGERSPVPAAGAAGDPTGVQRIHDRAEVRVVRRDPVGELVEVRLAHDGVAGLLEHRHAGRRALGHVVAEDRRPVRRRQPGRVDQVLDGERDPGRNLVGNREEGAVRVSQARRRSRRRPPSPPAGRARSPGAEAPGGCSSGSARDHPLDQAAGRAPWRRTGARGRPASS